MPPPTTATLRAFDVEDSVMVISVVEAVVVRSDFVLKVEAVAMLIYRSVKCQIELDERF